ncbi:MAG: hypothetical protein JWR79_1709, partial [Tardiphaga sp.]|nr:hypothetical protein [Tardiphaga sp.]
MKMPTLTLAATMIFATAAFAQSSDWQRYVIPQSGA